MLSVMKLSEASFIVGCDPPTHHIVGPRQGPDYRSAPDLNARARSTAIVPGLSMFGTRGDPGPATTKERDE